jgi:hypothetical protein
LPARRAVDGHAAEAPRQHAERPEEQVCLAEASGVELQRQVGAEAMQEIPVRGVRCDDQHDFGRSEVAGDAPAGEPHEQDAQRPAPTRRDPWRARRESREFSLVVCPGGGVGIAAYCA